VIRLLFVSGLARNRAPTAAQTVESWPGVRADFAGLDPGTDSPLSPEQLDWADEILVFEKRHKAALSRAHARRIRGRPVIDLDLPDLYTFMQPELVARLTDLLGPRLRPAAQARGERR
jgi:predicted protein tyrosine phosphatase